MYTELQKKQMRMQIAQEIIRNINSFNLTSGVYVTNTASSYDKVPDTQEQLYQDFMKCKVCGLGSMMIAHLKLFNHVDPNNFYEDIQLNNKKIIHAKRDNIKDYLIQYFSEEQIYMIEQSYEVFRENYVALTQEQCQNSYQYGRFLREQLYCGLKERLLLIMTNILMNGGTFIPIVPVFPGITPATNTTSVT